MLSGSADAGEEVQEEITTEPPCQDNDGDGFLDSDCGGDDCDDTRNDIFPGAAEVCGDGLDNDCDGLVDEPYFMLPGVLLNDETHGHPMDGGFSCDVSLVWTGSEFAVAWSFAESPSCPEVQPIYFTRLDVRGVEPGGDVALRHDASLSCYSTAHPRLAWTGSEIGLAWSWLNMEGEEMTSGASLARLSLSGEPLGDELHVTDPETPSSIESLLWTGSGFGIAGLEDNWGLSNDAIHFTTVNAGLSEAGDDVIVSSGQNRPAMVWTGSEFGVSWIEIISLGSRYEAHLARLDPSGEITSDSSKLFDITSSHAIELAWTGIEFVLAWNEDRNADGINEIHLARVSSRGVHLSEDLVLYENTSVESIGWNGTGFGLIMKDGEAISFGRVDATGLDVEEKVDLAFEGNEIACWSDLVWTGSEFGIAWTVLRRGSEWEIYFNRISLCD